MDNDAKWTLAIGCAAAAVGCAGPAAGQSIGDAIAAGKPILEVRPRFEFVDQPSLGKDAEAFTVRTRLGWRTATWNDFAALVEVEDVRRLGGERYNTTINGKTAYPVIADPDVTELNQLWVSWKPTNDFGATFGRQRINLDDQRFVGGVGWRQDEQTFDAVRADAKVGPVAFTVAYVDHVNRIFAERLDWSSDSWLVNAGFAGTPQLKPTAFVYALDFGNSAANPSTTYGLRVTGGAPLGGVNWAYSGTYAHQTDNAGNPADFALDYWQADLSATAGIVTVRAAYESLEGDGARGFATPLATLHAFQGWADVFLNTPANGVNDANLTLVVRPPIEAPHLSKVQFTAKFHDFEAERGGADLGEEIDLMAQAQFTHRLSGFIKYADYNGVAGLPSRRKLWFGFDFKL